MHKRTSIYNLEGLPPLGHPILETLMDEIQGRRGPVIIGARLNLIHPTLYLPQGLSSECGHWDTNTSEAIYLVPSGRFQLKLKQKDEF